MRPKAWELNFSVMQIMKVLHNAGSGLNDVVKTTIFLRNADDFYRMNEVYQKLFREDQPARSTVVTGMVMPSMLIEIECIAYRP